MQYRKVEPHVVDAFQWNGAELPGEDWVISAASAGVLIFAPGKDGATPKLSARIGNTVIEVPADSFVVKDKDDVFSIATKPAFKAAYVPESGAWPAEDHE